MPLSHCPVCGEPLSAPVAPGGRGDAVDCPRCGRFEITTTAQATLPAWEGDRRVLSGMCRLESDRGHPLRLTSDNLDEIVGRAPVPRTPLQALDNLVLYIGDRSGSWSSSVPVFEDRPPVSVALDANDLSYVIAHLRERGLIHIENDDNLRLTIEGWRRFQELRDLRPSSLQAFVAMWFADELTPAWTEGIRRGLEDAGYTAVRLDAVEHNEKIDDRIIAEIRRSGLVVADLTGGRANVYFEAGFAMGLGIPVIWTCREDHLDDLHFDTRQYNYIGWTTPAELRERLRLRIEATLPRKAEARR